MKTYLSNEIFPKGTVGLTGTPAQVDAAAKAYRAYYSKEGEGEGYLVNHFSGAYLMNPRGRFDRILPYGVSPDELARQISEAMRG
jgi:protein SCO1